jgi:hypothetical protein
MYASLLYVSLNLVYAHEMFINIPLSLFILIRDTIIYNFNYLQATKEAIDSRMKRNKFKALSKFPSITPLGGLELEQTRARWVGGAELEGSVLDGMHIHICM